jgi:hypothetical protein
MPSAQMPVNESEDYLFKIGHRSFLELWAYPNPYWGASPVSPPAKREELCDLLVVFGDTVIAFSDKSNLFPTSDDATLNWSRWYRRTITDSVKQLKKAWCRLRVPGSALFETHKAAGIFPLELPPLERMRIHLVAVARTAGDVCERDLGRRCLTIDTEVAGAEKYLHVGMTFDGLCVHLFDGVTLDTILSRLDTAQDLIAYLQEKERFLRECRVHIEGEENLLAAYLLNQTGPATYELPRASGFPRKIVIPDGLWNKYRSSDAYRHTVSENEISYNLDRLINQFAEDARHGRMLDDGDIPLRKHEEALRILASESRFGRRLLAQGLDSIWHEPDQRTTWFSLVESKDSPGCHYLWMTYPNLPGATLEETEAWAMDQLTARMLQVPSQFSADKIIGLGLPNRLTDMKTYFIRILIASDWTSADMRESENLAEKIGRFDTTKSETKIHFD